MISPICKFLKTYHKITNYQQQQHLVMLVFQLIRFVPINHTKKLWCLWVWAQRSTMMFFVCFTNSIIWNLTNQFMPEAIQTKHLPSSKTYVRDAIKVLRYLHCTNKSFSDQNIKGNFLKIHVLKISNQDKFFEILFLAIIIQVLKLQKKKPIF